MRNRYDVIVIGAGYVGCAAGYHLAAAGLRTAVLDKGRVGAGASTDNYGNIQVQDAELHHSLPMVTAGAARFEALEETLGQSVGLRRLGSLLAIENERQWDTMQARLPSLRAAGIDAEMVPAHRLPEIEPLLDPATLLGASYHPNEGQVNPGALMRAYVRAGERRGMVLHERTEVVGFDLAGGRIRSVGTTAGTFHAASVVLCTGAWTAGLGSLLGQRWAIRHIHDQAVTTAASDLKLRNHVTSAAFFQDLGDTDSGPILSVSQDGDGRFLLGEVGTTRADLGTHPSSKDEAAILDMVGRHFPSLRGIPVRRGWAAVVAVTADGLPYLGPVAAVSNLVLATAFKSTVAAVPMVGEMVADIVTGGRTAVDVGPFSPDRAS